LLMFVSKIELLSDLLNKVIKSSKW
jgi:hypothetical protein